MEGGIVLKRKLTATVAAALLSGLIIVPTANAATVRNVPANYPTISAAISASSSGDTVLVAPGSYSDNFTVPSGVTVESSGGPATTIVRGIGLAGPIAIINAGGTVRGLTLRDAGGNVFGGAAQVAGLLEDSRILNNTACYDPAIYLTGGTVRNNYFEGNQSVCFSPPVVDGGGSIIGNEFADNGHSPPIEIRSDTILVEGNYFHDPSVVMTTDGGQLQAIIRNNLVIATGATSNGLIDLSEWTGSPGLKIVNNTFVLGTGTGPLMNLRMYKGAITVANNVFVGQAGATVFKCVDDFDTLQPTVEGNDFWTPSGSGVAGSCAGVVGTSANISTDPTFVSTTLGDYHLRAYSPLIDAGVNGIAMAPDIDGDVRPLDGNENGTAVVDIGYDESTLALGVSPDAVDFGNVPLGRTVTRSVTATNLGAGPITIDTIGLQTFGDFAILGENCPAGPLAVGATCTIQVTFTPSVFGGETATLTVGGPGNTGSLDIPLAGSGVYPLTVTPPLVEFPNAVVGVGSASSITIANGGSPVTFISISVTGTTPGDVTIGAETCTAAPIPQDASCVIPFTFKATSDGARNALINVVGSGPVGTVVIPVNGTAHYAPSGITWGSTTAAGPANAWNGGLALARTVQSGVQRLHLAYSTDRIGGTWVTDSGPKVGVYYIYSSAGTTWSTPKRLNATSQHSTALGLAAAGSLVYAVWMSQSKFIGYTNTTPRWLYVRVNTNYGSSTAWRSALQLTSSTGQVDYPVIAATGTDAHIAYTYGNSGAVTVASSRDRGLTWHKTTVGSTTIAFSDGHTGFPTIAATGSTVAVCWLSDTAGTVKCRVSADRGVTWGTTTTLGSGATGYFSVTARGTRIGVAWTTATGVVFVQRTSGVWGTAQLVPTPSNLTRPYGVTVVLQDPNRIALTWTDHPAGANSSSLYWLESSNGGTLWYAVQQVGVPGSGRWWNDWPSVVWSSAGTRYVVWNGWTPYTTNYRLYTRKGTGTPSGLLMPSQPFLVQTTRVTVLAPGSMIDTVTSHGPRR